MLHSGLLSSEAEFLLKRFEEKALTLLFIANENGETPLHMAVKNNCGYVYKVQVLLDAAGSVAKNLILMPTIDGKTAIDYADEFGFGDIKNLLEQYFIEPAAEIVEQVELVDQDELLMIQDNACHAEASREGWANDPERDNSMNEWICAIQ